MTTELASYIMTVTDPPRTAVPGPIFVFLMNTGCFANIKPYEVLIFDDRDSRTLVWISAYLPVRAYAVSPRYIR